MYAKASEVMCEVAELLRPPRRTRPSEAASLYLANERGRWSVDLSPMMVEPLDQLAGRDYRGVVFVGPARTGKTFSLVHGAISYAVTAGAGDLMVVQTSQDSARDFSRTEVDRVLRHSPELAARMSTRARDDSTHEKYTRAGNVVKIGWPTVTQLSGRTVQFMLLADYDRPEFRDNVDGEGPLWDLALKRTETFMSRGKCLAESSPGEDFTMSDWRPATPHEAPPAKGIVSLYNTGTRARWYWPCQHCGQFFQAAPGVEIFRVPEFDQLEKLVVQQDLHTLAAQYARVACPVCGGLHEQSQRLAMNRGGHWLHEGESFAPDGTVVGERRRTPTASYWLAGAAAVFQRWDSLLYRYLSAVQTFVRLGDEAQLKTVTNTDLAQPYLPRYAVKRRSGKELRKRAEFWEPGTVPSEVRFLTAAADVQGSRFVVQIHGWGKQLESWLIDRFNLSASKRQEGSRFAAIDPAAFLEDWDVLSEALVGRTYPLALYPNQTMGIRFALCDSGGREGVSTNAYSWWRGLRRKGHGKRIKLLKGTGNPNTPRFKKTYPDSTERRDRKQGGKGDVPVYLLNVNVLKDTVANDLARDQLGPGYVHLPNWLDDSVFDELTSEVRTAKGWIRPGGVRNEAFDLAVYNRACAIIVGGEKIDWKRPPAWAAERSSNPPPVVVSRHLEPPRRSPSQSVPWIKRGMI